MSSDSHDTKEELGWRRKLRKFCQLQQMYELLTKRKKLSKGKRAWQSECPGLIALLLNAA